MASRLLRDHAGGGLSTDERQFSGSCDFTRWWFLSTVNGLELDGICRAVMALSDLWWLKSQYAPSPFWLSFERARQGPVIHGVAKVATSTNAVYLILRYLGTA